MLQNNFYTSRIFIRCSYVQSTKQICCKHLIWHDVSADQILHMTLYSFRSCKFSPPSEFFNVIATQMPGQKTLNIGSSLKVSPQNEFLNVLATYLTWQMLLNTGSSCKVSPQNEFLNVLATQMTGQKKDFEHWEQLYGFSPE